MRADILSDENCLRRVTLVKEAWDRVSQCNPPGNTSEQEDIWINLVAKAVAEAATPLDLTLFPNGIVAYVEATIRARIYG